MEDDARMTSSSVLMDSVFQTGIGAINTLTVRTNQMRTIVVVCLSFFFHPFNHSENEWPLGGQLSVVKVSNSTLGRDLTD